MDELPVPHRAYVHMDTDSQFEIPEVSNRRHGVKTEDYRLGKPGY